MKATARPPLWLVLTLSPAVAWVIVWLIGPNASSAVVAMDMPFGRDLGIVWRALALIGTILSLALTFRGLGHSMSEEHHTGTAEWVALGAGSAVLLALVSSADLPRRGDPPGTAVAEARSAAAALAAEGPHVDLSVGTHVVLLGTGTPNPDPDASGPATAIVVDGKAYIVDVGAGVVRRATAAARLYASPALEARNLDIAFLTHLHSDHTVGLPDLVYTTWVAERNAPLRLFGPDGTASLAEHLTAAYGADIENRLAGLEPATPDGWRIDASDSDEGLVYEDDRVRVTAFRVPHTGWDEAFAYRFDSADRSIVISGDGTPSDAVVDACSGCDVLVHEVYSAARFQTRPDVWQTYHAQSHTSTVELADIARRANPGILVLYHQLGWGATPQEMLDEVRAAGYDGPLAYGRDLDAY
ncbi:MAG: MBL fold metallo-hydrolase [Gemmatimonadota bacterium]